MEALGFWGLSRGPGGFYFILELKGPWGQKHVLHSG